MLSRHFIWLKEEYLEAVRANIADDGHCKIRGIRKLHQIITKPNKSMVYFCIKGRVESCQAAESSQYFRHSINVLKAKCYQFHESDSDKDNDDEELNEIDMFIENDATKCIIKCDIAIICTGDDQMFGLISSFLINRQQLCSWSYTFIH